MIHPCTEIRFINDEIGSGVVATERIPKGTITWALDQLDREFTPSQVLKFEEPYQRMLGKYCYRNSRGAWVLCWDHARFVNHSFRSNCLSTAYGFELAVRDIHPGDEVTNDYGCLNIIEPFRANDEGSRRKNVYPDDLLKYHRVWDKMLRSAFECLPLVEQPLREFLPLPTWEKCIRIAGGNEDMDSILNIYFDEMNGNGMHRRARTVVDAELARG